MGDEMSTILQEIHDLLASYSSSPDHFLDVEAEARRLDALHPGGPGVQAIANALAEAGMSRSGIAMVMGSELDLSARAESAPADRPAANPGK